MTGALQEGLAGLKMQKMGMTELEELMGFQQMILDELEDKQWYVPSTLEEMREDLAQGDIFGCYDGKKLVAFAVLTPWHTREEIAYAGKVGETVEDTYDFHGMMVHPKYRRRGIHSAFLRLFAETVRAMGGKAIYATIAPENLPSVNAFEKGGYELVKTQLAYDGRPRGYYRQRL